jgi:3-mercaptopropionate dioxygenase
MSAIPPLQVHTDFPGCEALIDSLDEAVSQPDHESVTQALRGVLCRAIRDRGVRLPASVHEEVEGHYARRELYRSPTHGYSVVAMTWGPGQGTLVHDHAGLWCVEGVWEGQLEITQYECLEDSGECCRFRPAGTINAGTGSAGSLIPPHEFHTIRNPSDDAIAISLHIYQAPITCCSVFEPLEGDRYRRCARELSVDNDS